jgi:hypothetical protein
MNPMKGIPPERNDEDLPLPRRRRSNLWSKRSTNNIGIGLFAVLVLFGLIVYLVSLWLNTATR